MLLSALSFSLMQAVVKLSATHIGTMEQVFCRNLISMAISFVLLRRSHLPLLGGRKYQPALLARSFFGFIGVVMLFYATAGARQADRLSNAALTVDRHAGTLDASGDAD